jgi:hypothetical protein
LALSLVLPLSVLLSLTLIIAVPVLRRLTKRPSVDEITPEWLENFSLDRYRTMSGLLANDDFAFLSRQPGFDLSLYKKLRRERLQIFRQYFNRLIVDFNRLHLTARALVAQNPQDSSAMAASLFRLQIRFYGAVLRTECAYTLCRLGLCTLNVQRLVEPIQALSEQIGAVVPVAA